MQCSFPQRRCQVHPLKTPPLSTAMLRLVCNLRRRSRRWHLQSLLLAQQCLPFRIVDRRLRRPVLGGVMSMRQAMRPWYADLALMPTTSAVVLAAFAMYVPISSRRSQLHLSRCLAMLAKGRSAPSGHTLLCSHCLLLHFLLHVAMFASPPVCKASPFAST